MDMEIRLTGTQSEMDHAQDLIRQQWQPINDGQLFIKESAEDFRVIEILVPEPRDKNNVSLTSYWAQVLNSRWLKISTEKGFRIAHGLTTRIGSDAFIDVFETIIPDIRDSLEIYCKKSRVEAGGAIAKRELDYCTAQFITKEGRCGSWYADDNDGVCPKKNSKCSMWIELRNEPDESGTTRITATKVTLMPGG